MKALYLEPFSGLSGDMLNGLLLDLGGDLNEVKRQLADFPLSNYDLVVNKKAKSSIYGTDFDVQLHGQTKDMGIKGDFKQSSSKHEHSHEHHHHHGRGLTEILGLIDQSGLSETVKEHSRNVFRDIAKAEAAVHHVDMQKIHFHEIGATDSIVDIVAFFILWEQLEIKRVYSTPITEGSGTIHVAHGEMPVPVPAVMQLRKNYPLQIVQDFEVKTELVTPTGLAIFKEISPEFKQPDQLFFEQVGYGFGKRDTGKFNALRGSILTIEPSHQEVRKNEDGIIKIEANLDDQTPEQIGYATKLLLENGALDVFCTPIQMKKNRPGILLTVLTNNELFDQLTYLILKHTNTAGFRYQTMQRRIMQRSFNEFEFQKQKIRVKTYQYQDIKKVKLEFDDCQKIAAANGWSLPETLNHIKKILKRFKGV
ncbi:nickel pincer cofactor biosynthesis protein LarC [Pediococcus acidilactici]|uniref:Pyridinium-3,5-bisthiocarboxylic acid mononucleotide nickel insertion protein n=1 Tax=Pediococcus acidilactici TaxID=1254 RepID=A0AAW8YQ44_PEDAC|nr:nickel pincer cofactor biosynthesis protein LarC [Pediococcus acidilactici]MDV2911966.1 nickel pincer cofactor biosynthesis protein LarC [Pediococcus acidilactici]WQS17485.1 nickel pincer cofactor biosynthesis protein LarC [Pediococcus acidilactici]